MKLWGLLCALLFLSACVGGGDDDDDRKRPRPQPPRTEAPDRQLKICMADLRSLNVRYEPLPDRFFNGGCSATGAVKLLDVGLPIANLGAMKCGLARPFAIWTREAIQHAARVWLDARVVKVESMGTYSCRPVNGQAGNKLSEHGRANAVDISGFVLADGRRITVKQGWHSPDPRIRDFLRAIHKSACRRFGVVLGPDANALHHDHFHFDMGRGPYCR